MTCDNLCSLAEQLVEDQYTIHHLVFSVNFAMKYVNQMLVRVRRAIFIFNRVEYFFSPFSFYVSLLLWSSCCVMRFTISLVQILFFPTICRFFLEVNLFLSFFVCRQQVLIFCNRRDLFSIKGPVCHFSNVHVFALHVQSKDMESSILKITRI